MEIKARGFKEFEKELKKIEAFAQKLDDALSKHQGDPEGLRLAFAEAGVNYKPRQIPLMTEEDAMEALEDAAMLEIQMSLEDIADMLSGE